MGSRHEGSRRGGSRVDDDDGILRTVIKTVLIFWVGLPAAFIITILCMIMVFGGGCASNFETDPTIPASAWRRAFKDDTTCYDARDYDDHWPCRP